MGVGIAIGAFTIAIILKIIFFIGDHNDLKNAKNYHNEHPFKWNK